MEILKSAAAGTLESSDAMVTVEPGEDGIELELSSSVMNQYGRQIKATILETLDRLEVKNARVTVVDKGALDCTLKARVECAVFRSCDASSANIPWGGAIRWIRRPKPERFRLRRTMMFMNAQKPGLIKDAYIYGCDSIMLDLEDAVAENQKDAARFSLYHALTTIDYGNTEVIVRINGLDTPHWQEDIRVCVAGGADGIRIAKCESAQDVHTVEAAVEAAEREFGVEVGRTLLMAALESPKGILNAYEICSASDRMLGVAISGGDFRKCMQTKFTPDGVDMMVARGQMLLAARAAGIQCFDTVFTDLDDNEGFKAEVLQNKAMGFDGKSLINPKQIRLVHEVFAPTEKEVKQAEAVVRAFKEQSAAGVGVFTVNGKMIDVAFIPGAERTLRLAKACGMYEGDLV